jgi:hypothetical protein
MVIYRGLNPKQFGLLPHTGISDRLGRVEPIPPLTHCRTWSDRPQSEASSTFCPKLAGFICINNCYFLQEGKELRMASLTISFDSAGGANSVP